MIKVNAAFITKIKRYFLSFFLLLMINAVLIGTMTACSMQDSDSVKAAEQTVTKHLEANKNNDYDAYKSSLWTRSGDDQNPSTFQKAGDLGVISLTIEKIEYSSKETLRI